MPKRSLRKIKQPQKKSPSTKKLSQSFLQAFADLTGKHPDARFYASKFLAEKGGKEMLPLFKAVANNKDPHISIEGLSLVSRWGTRKDLPFLNKFMYSKNQDVKLSAIEFMSLCREPETLKYLNERLSSASDLATRKATIRAISFHKPRDYELYAELSENPKFKDPSKRITRLPHVKDGSTSVLLGGKLYDQAIIRGGATIAVTNQGRQRVLHGLRSPAIEAWKTALTFDWKKVGLSHTPIEPILKKNGRYRIFMNRDGTYRVSAGVIQGESYYAFLRKHNVGIRVKEELERQKRRIIEGFTELGIDHSHLHEANILVTMEKNKPKLYVIDFDAAGFSKNRITILTNPNYGY